MDVRIEELLSLLSDRVKSEMAKDEIERQRKSEVRWLLAQQEYLIATLREFFTEFAQRIDDIEDQVKQTDYHKLVENINRRLDDMEKLILSSDLYLRSLQKQLAQELINLSRLQEEQARLGGDVSNKLLNELEETRKRIERIREEMEVEEGDNPR